MDLKEESWKRRSLNLWGSSEVEPPKPNFKPWENRIKQYLDDPVRRKKLKALAKPRWTVTPHNVRERAEKDQVITAKKE